MVSPDSVPFVNRNSLYEESNGHVADALKEAVLLEAEPVSFRLLKVPHAVFVIVSVPLRVNPVWVI